jgi:hypothetical protein
MAGREESTEGLQRFLLVTVPMHDGGCLSPIRQYGLCTLEAVCKRSPWLRPIVALHLQPVEFVGHAERPEEPMIRRSSADETMAISFYTLLLGDVHSA